MIIQLLTLIKKDFKMLLRSKSSTLAVLLGPLLVILLVGMVFTNADTPDLTLGFMSEEFENVQLYKDSLDDAFVLLPYEEQATCVDAVRQGIISSCVKLEAGTPPRARVFVDPSDVNVVYAVIDRITGQLDNQSSVLRAGLATQLIDSISKAAIKLESDAEDLEEAAVILNNNQGRADELSSGVRDIELDVRIVGRNEVQSAIDSSLLSRDDYKEFSEKLLSEYQQFVNQQADSNDPMESRLERIDDYALELEEYEDRIREANAENTFNDLLDGLEDLNVEIENSQASANAFGQEAEHVSQAIGRAELGVRSVLSSIEQSRDSLGSIGISRTDITSPLEPVIEPVATEFDTIGFVLPYFLVLIVMFTSVLLASTMIVRERESRAYFRNVMTPVPEWIFGLSTYFTTTIMLVVQLVVIGIVANIALGLTFQGQVFVLILLLFVIVTFFTLLGMLVGHSFKTQEGVMLAAIAVSSILLFLSDLVLPVETMPGLVQYIVQSNPFVLAAALLKAAIVFKYGLAQLQGVLWVLIAYGIVLFALTMIVQRLARVRYFEGGASEKISAFLGTEEIPQGKELVLGEWEISSKLELLSALKTMDDEEYEQYASHKNNFIVAWILDVYKDERLAEQLRNRSRRGAIMVLEKEVKKE